MRVHEHQVENLRIVVNIIGMKKEKQNPLNMHNHWHPYNFPLIVFVLKETTFIYIVTNIYKIDILVCSKCNKDNIKFGV